MTLSQIVTTDVGSRHAPGEPDGDEVDDKDGQGHQPLPLGLPLSRNTDKVDRELRHPLQSAQVPSDVCTPSIDLNGNSTCRDVLQ